LILLIYFALAIISEYSQSYRKVYKQIIDMTFVENTKNKEVVGRNFNG